MDDVNLNSVFLVQMLGNVLRRVDRAMASARASEAAHQMSESALHETLCVSIYEFVHAFEEG